MSEETQGAVPTNKRDVTKDVASIVSPVSAGWRLRVWDQWGLQMLQELLSAGLSSEAGRGLPRSRRCLSCVWPRPCPHPPGV